MKNLTVCILSLVLLLPMACFAHEDPLGEVNPYFAEQDGNLWVYFRVLTTNGYSPRCARVHPEERLVDKRPAERGEHSAAIKSRWDSMTWDGEGWVSIAYQSDGPGLIRLGQGNAEFIPLDWGDHAQAFSPIPAGIYSIGSFWAVSVGRWETDEARPDHLNEAPKLSVCWFDKKTRRLLWDADLGRPVLIMATQVYSPVVEWKGMPVVAFVERTPSSGDKHDFDIKAWRIVLATFDVAKRRLRKQTIVEKVNWNTSLDLHVWNGDLWLAFHDVDVKKDADFDIMTDATIRLKKVVEID